MTAPSARTGIVLAFCLALHGVFFTWLYRSAPRIDFTPVAAPTTLQVRWIAAQAPSLSPPMPRKSRSAKPAAAASMAQPPLVSVPLRVETPEPAAAPLRRTRRLADQLHELDLLPPGEARFGKHDPMNPMRARLPSSDQRIVGNFTLRREITPADVVNAVGGFLFGGNYDPCPDIRGKLNDATLLHPDRYDNAQRRDLIERERRCRYR